MVVVEDLSANLAARNLTVHEVQAAQEGGLAAAGGADEGRDLARAELEARLVEGLVREVVGNGHILGREKRGLRVGVTHSAVSLLARNLPSTRASTLKSSTHTSSTVAVPHTISVEPGVGSEVRRQM